MTGWFRPVEQLVLSSTRDRRVIGITAPHVAVGVSTTASAFAEISARWGARTLLVDLSHVYSENHGGRCWAPGIGDPRQFIEASDQSFDFLQAVPSPATLGAVDTTRTFRQCLADDLGEYGAIVVDLAPILEWQLDAINPLVAAVACDGVIVVCAQGITTEEQLRRSVESIRTAGGSVIGTVLNDVSASGGRTWRRRKS